MTPRFAEIIYKNMMTVFTANSVCLALDTSYEQGAVVLFRGDEILYARTLDKKLSHGKLICEAIDEALSVNDGLSHVFCGLGPGSFVGVRIALATALGFCFARDLPLMGFCSHEALALSLAEQNYFALFMKASGDLGYLTSFSNLQKIEETTVVSIHELTQKLKPNSLVFSDMAERITVMYPAHLHAHKMSGPSPSGIVAAARARMIGTAGFIDEQGFIKPNYIKSPNVSLPIPPAN